jgi:hypothetical protein
MRGWVKDRANPPQSPRRNRPARSHAGPQAPVPPLHRELLDALGHVLETQQFILGEPVAAFERRRRRQLGVAHAWAARRAPTPCGWRWPPPESAPAMPSSPPRSASSPRSAPFSAPAPRRCWPTSTPPPSTWTPLPSRPFSKARGAAVAPFCPCISTASAPIGPPFRAWKERGLKLIEDAAQAWGAEWKA